MTANLAVNDAIRSYATFDGRSGRAQFWWFVLYLLAFGLLFDSLDQVTHSEAAFGLWSLATFLPNLAVSVRRLHDTGRSGWILISLVPLLGFILLLVWFCSRSELGANAYGADPPEVADSASGTSSRSWIQPAWVLVGVVAVVGSVVGFLVG